MKKKFQKKKPSPKYSMRSGLRNKNQPPTTVPASAHVFIRASHSTYLKKKTIKFQQLMHNSMAKPYQAIVNFSKFIQ